MKKYWWQITLITLLVILIAMLATFLKKQQEIRKMPVPAPEEHRPPFQRNKMGHRGKPASFEKFFRNEFEFNDKQLEDFKKIREEFHKNMRTLSNQRKELEKELISVLHSPNIKSEKLDSVTYQMGLIYGKQQLFKIKYLQYLKENTDEIHHEKLDSLMKRMMSRDMNRDMPRNRGHHKRKMDSLKTIKNQDHGKEKFN